VLTYCGACVLIYQALAPTCDSLLGCCHRLTRCSHLHLCCAACSARLYKDIFIFVCLFVCLSVCVSVCLSIHQSVHSLIHSFTHSLIHSLLFYFIVLYLFFNVSIALCMRPVHASLSGAEVLKCTGRQTQGCQPCSAMQSTLALGRNVLGNRTCPIACGMCPDGCIRAQQVVLERPTMCMDAPAKPS